VIKEPRSPLGQAVIKLAQEIDKRFTEEATEAAQPVEAQRRAGLGRLL